MGGRTVNFFVLRSKSPIIYNHLSDVVCKLHQPFLNFFFKEKKKGSSYDSFESHYMYILATITLAH